MLAAKHVNNIWGDPNKWYNSKEVLKVRNLYLRQSLNIVLPRNKKKEEKRWKSIFR